MSCAHIFLGYETTRHTCDCNHRCACFQICCVCKLATFATLFIELLVVVIVAIGAAVELSKYLATGRPLCFTKVKPAAPGVAFMCSKSLFTRDNISCEFRDLCLDANLFCNDCHTKSSIHECLILISHAAQNFVPCHAPYCN